MIKEVKTFYLFKDDGLKSTEARKEIDWIGKEVCVCVCLMESERVNMKD